jgi:membrane-bound inhibitor of C-type lysozyme
MPSSDSKARARVELLDLIESQVNTLEKEIFGVVTEEELCEYEKRCDRVRQLYAEVINDRDNALMNKTDGPCLIEASSVQTMSGNYADQIYLE